MGIKLENLKMWKFENEERRGQDCLILNRLLLRLRADRNDGSFDEDFGGHCPVNDVS